MIFPGPGKGFVVKTSVLPRQLMFRTWFSLCRTIVDTIDRYNLEGTEEKFEKVQCSNLKF